MPYDIIIGRDDSDKKKFGKKGLIYLGKGYVKMGNYTSLSNLIYMDIARSHVVLVAGKRGSGKSYSLGVMAEELANLPKEVSQNIAPLIFDTMGIFWTMKYKNEKDKMLLKDWNLKSMNLPIRVFVPYGKAEDYRKNQIPVDESFALKASELDTGDWLLTFNLGFIDPVSVLIETTLSKLNNRGEFDIDDILQELEKTDDPEKKAAQALFRAADSWGIFSRKGHKGTKINDLTKAGETTILDLSCYSSLASFNVRALVIGLVSRKLFVERMNARKKEEIEAVHNMGIYSEKKQMPLVWIFIDEAHEFLPMHDKTPATDALIQLLREGRQPGISLVLATQQPGVIHRDVMTQSDIVISHRVTAAPDIEALNNIMQTYLMTSIRKNLDDLPDLKGSAIILDDNSERIYPVRIRPRFTWHGGEAPIAIKEEKEF